MVAFLAGTDNARVNDLWSTEYSTPAFDTQQDYTLVSQVPITNIQGVATAFNVTATRLLDTGDTKQDQIIPIVRFKYI